MLIEIVQPGGVVVKHSGLWTHRREFESLPGYHIKNLKVKSMADLKGCPFGQDIKNDCKNCDYGDTNHFDAARGKCVKR